MQSRLTGLLVIGALLASACGTQLDEEEVAAHAMQQASLGRADDAPATDGEATTVGGPAPVAVPSEATVAGPATTTVVDAPATGSPTGSSTATGPGTTSTAPTDAPTTPGGSAVPPPAAVVDTRSMPPGGNGGATDVGVYEDRIVIYNVADRTGAVPGLFQDAQEATQAYILKFLSEQGTVYGRTIELVNRDSKLSTQENRAAYLDACNGAFAGVGSMSAFEQGAAEPIRSCGLPDIRTSAVTLELQTEPWVRSTLALTPGLVGMSEWGYLADTFGDIITDAAFLYIDGATTHWNTTQVIEATERHRGYEWDAHIAIALSEVNYASIIQQLKDQDIRLVAFQGAYQQAVRLARTMRQQNYQPDVFMLQANTYIPDMITEGGEVMEGFTLVSVTGSLLEEGNPELTEYATWLARVNPRARPTGLGQLGWGAAKMFVEAITAIGPNLTRQGLLDHINANYTAYGADGLFPEQNIATQHPASCVIILDVTAEAFVRRAPATGYICGEVGDIRDQ